VRHGRAKPVVVSDRATTGVAACRAPRMTLCAGAACGTSRRSIRPIPASNRRQTMPIWPYYGQQASHRLRD